jgi:hypothetical protein
VVAPVRQHDDPALSRIRAALRELAADRLEHRIEPEEGLPLGPLEEELNQTAERLQRRREELVRAVELYCLHRFGSVLVHDLKNLAGRLHFVPGNLRSAPEDPEVVEACAATVEDTVERLQQLVVRFRDQREAMVLKQRSDVNRVVRSAVDQSGAVESGIRTEVLLEDLPALTIDPPYLEEAFVNILRNAVEAMNGEGKLRVRSRRKDGPNGVPHVEVCIMDDGPGMTREFIDRELFAPFRSTKDRGLGLGMFSCRETVELHGGRVQVESEPGRGTTFHVLLPIPMQEERLG